MDIGPPTTITGVVTKGRGDTGRKQWVTKYTISYSNDSTTWTFYKDSLNLETKVSPSKRCHKTAKMLNTMFYKTLTKCFLIFEKIIVLFK